MGGGGWSGWREGGVDDDFGDLGLGEETLGSSAGADERGGRTEVIDQAAMSESGSLAVRTGVEELRLRHDWLWWPRLDERRGELRGTLRGWCHWPER